MTRDPEAGSEFEDIERLFRPLAAGSPESRDLLDDVAAIPSRPGFDLIVTTDTIVEGVHFLHDDPLDLVARKLLRVNLSDLAGKGAEPYGYLLNVSWPRRCGAEARSAFASGLAIDQTRYGLRLFGGDTTSTVGPLVAGATAFGWAPHGATPRRSGARVGDLVMVSGVIGDGWLGLMAASGRIGDLEPERLDALVQRYRLPEPRLSLAKAVRTCASASADVSDGLVADLGHIASASQIGADLWLDALPRSRAAAAWLAHRVDLAASLTDLATSGDDYEIVCAVRPESAGLLRRLADDAGTPFTEVGVMREGAGVRVTFEGAEVRLDRTGWVHR